MALMIIRGEFDYLNLYNVSTGLKTLNPNTKYKVEELYEVVQNLLESGELDALVSPLELKLADLDTLEIEIDENIIEEKNFTLKNKNFLELLNLQTAKESDIYLIRHFMGEGEISYEIDQNIDPNNLENLSFDYLDCSEEFDQYDILREGYLQNFCDSIIIDTLKFKDNELSFEDIIFEPQITKDELYIVKTDPISEVKLLEKLEIGGDRLFGTDLDLEDYEEK